MKPLSLLALLIGLVALPFAPARAALPQSKLDTVGIAVPDGARLPAGLTFTGSDGKTTTLKQVLAGRPAMLVFADYTCHTLCGTTIAMTSDALVKSGLDPKSDFRFVVIGIDPKDTPADARAMRKKYLKGGLAGPETHFLIGSKRNVAAATAAAGYTYVYDRDEDQFAHPTAAFVLGPDGTVTRVLTAIGITPDAVRLALVSASNGSVGTFVDHIRLLCYCLDPASGIYNASIQVWLQVLGTLTVVLLGLAIFMMTRRRRTSGGGGEAVS